MEAQASPEIVRVSRFLFSRLSAETNLEIWQGEAPQSAPLPLISFNLRPRPDKRHKLGTAMTLYEVTARVMYKGSLTNAEPHLRAIDAALHSAAGDGISCRRSSTFSAPGVYIGGEEERTEGSGYVYEVAVD